DPVALGLVASLNQPGGNITGVTSLNVEVGPKRLELLREMVPKANAITILVNPTNPNAEVQSKDAERAARTLGLQLHVLNASADRDLNSILESLVQARSGGVVIGSDSYLSDRSEHLAALMLDRKVPAISPYRDFAAAGGLMTYGGSALDQNRQAGV